MEDKIKELHDWIIKHGVFEIPIEWWGDGRCYGDGYMHGLDAVFKKVEELMKSEEK